MENLAFKHTFLPILGVGISIELSARKIRNSCLSSHVPQAFSRLCINDWNGLIENSFWTNWACKSGYKIVDANCVKKSSRRCFLSYYKYTEICSLSINTSFIGQKKRIEMLTNNFIVSINELNKSFVSPSSPDCCQIIIKLYNEMFLFSHLYVTHNNPMAMARLMNCFVIYVCLSRFHFSIVFFLYWYLMTGKSASLSPYCDSQYCVVTFLASEMF